MCQQEGSKLKPDGKYRKEIHPCDKSSKDGCGQKKTLRQGYALETYKACKPIYFCAINGKNGRKYVCEQITWMERGNMETHGNGGT